MKAQELRIGNLVYFGVVKEPIVIKIIDPESPIILMAEPIELTEEWLLKFGFEKDFNGYRLKDKFSLSFTSNFLPCWLDRPLLKNELKHVHQLQNLYFALTSTELIINQ